MRRTTSVLFVLLCPAMALAVHNEETEEITIKGRRAVLEDSGEISVAPERSTPSAPDSAQLLELAPGGAVNWNGPVSGQVQYRGLHGPRVGNRVNGVEITPGGPNWMDPPLHYAPRSLVEELSLERGVAAVSSGAETLGGALRTELLRSHFSDGDAPRFDGRLNLESRSVDRSLSGGALLGMANQRQRLHLMASGDSGGHTRSPDGTIRNTQYQRIQIGTGYGLRLGDAHELGLDFRYNDTRDSGTPVLPMDIRFLETQLWSASYSGQLGPAALQGRLYYTGVEHEMDNFSLRLSPAAPMFRRVEASGDSGGFELGSSVPLPLGELAFGVDAHLSTHDQQIFNPNAAAFFVHNFNDATRQRYSGYAEWSGQPFGPLTAEIGVRYARVEMDTGNVASPPPLAPLRDRFNGVDHGRSDDQVDAVARLQITATEKLRFEISGGRKTRSPNHLERYSWAPIEVTAGLGDGNNYIGNIYLEPEVSHEVAAGLHWSGYGVTFAPQGFYKSVDDYIQGVPTTDVLAPPGTLQWTNVDAELYGVDAELGVDLPGPLQLDGSISYVRGVRRDVNDNLFRIAPLRGRATLSWQAERWFAAVEGIFAGEQDQVSLTNGETPSNDYALMNLYGGFEPWPGVELLLGIDNVTGELYRDHLAGINRAGGSGVALGQRLPGPGRSFYGRVALRFGAELE